jgi:hypothetical protein
MANGRPKKSSAELIRTGARRGRIEARQREEALEQGAKIEQDEKAAAARGMSLASFIERVKKERESFFERLDPGETVCKEYGAAFNGARLLRLRSLLRLARSRRRAVQQFGGLLQGYLLSHRPKVDVLLIVMNVDGFEEQRLPIHGYDQTGHLPMPAADVFLVDDEGSPFVQVAQDPAAEFHLAREMAVDFNEPFLQCID